MSMSSQEQAIVTLLQEAVHGIFRRWKLILGAYVGLVLMAVFGVFVIPPTYRAAGKILFTTDRADISTSADRGTELVRTSQVSESEMNSQLQILRSRELIDGVLAEMQPPKEEEEPPPQDESWLGRMLRAPVTLARTAYKRLHGLDNLKGDDPLYWRARGVLQHLQISNEKPSNIVEIGYVSSDPAWAQEFVNRLMQSYVEHHAKMQQISEAQDFFTSQSELLRQKLSASEAELQKARERAGSLAGQQAEVHERLNEFNADLSRARIARSEQEQRVAFLEQTLNGAKDGKVATPELLELEAKRADLIGKYKPDSERVKAIDSQIERLRRAISGYDTITAGASGEGGGTGTDLVAARATLASLKGREDALEKTAEKYRKQAEFLDSQGFDLARLERQVKLDEETYTSYVRSAEQSRLSNAMEQSKLLRLRIIEPAELPLEAVAPKKGQIILFALVGGLLLSLGLGLARDHFDTTIKSSADVRRYANLDTLVSLPDRS
jgi:succinoglycan biosynthesis transport protein ExoP